ncbi:MAG: amino acid-binding protein [Planctomycetia bacterium]|nr:amino acid-binding protein [Planctomycetia bacterium]
MKIKQLSVFLENKPGHLSAICARLADAKINILTLSLADTQQFGILRLIVEQWEQAMKLLQEAGFVVRLTEVVATEINDEPGGLASILRVLETAGLNVEYMYAFTFHAKDKAILVFRFDDPDTAVGVLQRNGINVFDDVELYRLG